MTLKVEKTLAYYDARAASRRVTWAAAAEMDRRGLTRADVARRMGVCRSRVTQIFDGRVLTFVAAARFARAVGLRFTVKMERAEESGTRSKGAT